MFQGITLTHKKKVLHEQELRQSSVRQALLASPAGVYKDSWAFVVRGQSIIVTAKNKALASALFLIKDDIKKLLPDWVEELVVR